MISDKIGIGRYEVALLFWLFSSDDDEDADDGVDADDVDLTVVVVCRGPVPVVIVTTYVATTIRHDICLLACFLVVSC